jgi:hypothetical protein
MAPQLRMMNDRRFLVQDAGDTACASEACRPDVLPGMRWAPSFPTISGARFQFSNAAVAEP